MDYKQKYIKYKLKYLLLKGGESYEKYSGKFEPIMLTKGIKVAHHIVKDYYINKYLKNSSVLIDIGSGRGTDAKHWVNVGVKFAIGIEPSEESIKQAIHRYKQLLKLNQGKHITKIIYLNGLGNKNWSTGEASLRDQDKERFIKIFGKQQIKASNINLFWTFHYMIDTETDFKTTLSNIKNSIAKNGILILMVMDGEMIKQNLNKEGIYNIEYNDQSVLTLTKINETDTPFGNRINVKLAGTYGLEKGIDENLVDINYFIKQFEDVGFTLIEKTRFTEVPINEIKEEKPYEKKVSELYVTLVFRF